MSYLLTVPKYNSFFIKNPAFLCLTLSVFLLGSDRDMTTGNPFVLIGSFASLLVVGDLFQQLYTFVEYPPHRFAVPRFLRNSRGVI